MILIVILKWEFFNQKLKEFKIQNSYHKRFKLFKGTDSSDRIKCLHLNEINNIKVKFNILVNINVKDKVTHKEYN